VNEPAGAPAGSFSTGNSRKENVLKHSGNSSPAGLHQTGEENIMPQSTHDRAAELHNMAAHAHLAAATAHGKADYQNANELSKHACELSLEAHKHSQQLAEEAEKSGKA
jgi:hypothetical protein